MTDPESNVYDALCRVETFFKPHAAAFTPGSQAVKDIARVSPLLQEIGPPKQTPGLRASPATGAKAHLFEEVRDDLEAIAATATTIGKKDPLIRRPLPPSGRHPRPDPRRCQTHSQGTRKSRQRRQIHHLFYGPGFRR